MGEVRNRPKIYPASISAQVSEQIKEAIQKEAQRLGVKEADVVRDWLERGRRSARRSAS